MIFADRKELWPRLENLGAAKVKEMLASDNFEAHEVEEVQEWLNKRSAISTDKDTQIAKIVALVTAIAAIIAAIASVVGLWRK
jgi:formylmethanofuran dehydrogenase subunit A